MIKTPLFYSKSVIGTYRYNHILSHSSEFIVYFNKKTYVQYKFNYFNFMMLTIQTFFSSLLQIISKIQNWKVNKKMSLQFHLIKIVPFIDHFGPFEW